MKNLVLLALAAFVVFWMVTDPSSLADRAGTGAGAVVDVLNDGASALRDFIGEF